MGWTTKYNWWFNGDLASASSLARQSVSSMIFPYHKIFNCNVWWPEGNFFLVSSGCYGCYGVTNHSVPFCSCPVPCASVASVAGQPLWKKDTKNILRQFNIAMEKGLCIDNLHGFTYNIWWCSIAMLNYWKEIGQSNMTSRKTTIFT